jgi:hypothetical protein
MQKWILFKIKRSYDHHKLCQTEQQKCTIANTSRHILADIQTKKRVRPPLMRIETYICIISFHPPQGVFFDFLKQGDSFALKILLSANE